ncbi:MAG: penicillin acylase family protein [Candidatus Latescibacterota bacterium]|nr:penicillin acylase family protein [Candidatus Latescibacterota bacterium]
MNPDRTARASAVVAVLRGDATRASVCNEHRIDGMTFRAWVRELLEQKHSDPNAQLRSPSIREGGRIRRDTWGVAHCQADSLGDLCFAVGVAQAQDRLWQLDYRRRLAAGRLAEILGRDYVAGDREHRTLGFRRIVEQEEEPALSDEARMALTGYAAGVNAWIERCCGNLPIEFDVLGYEPEPWTIFDSLSILRYFWWTLTGRLSQLAAAERLLRNTDPALAKWFLTPETVSYIVAGDEASAAHGASEADDPSQTPGSNNWAAAASLLTQGGPVLAADPHWPVAFPDMWYDQHLQGAGMDVIGPAYPGVPTVIFGRTHGLAWGRTNNVSSTRDLYHERIDPCDSESYWTGSEWRPFKLLAEEIDVRGEMPELCEVRLTHERRPVVDEFVPDVEREPAEVERMTLRWVGQERIEDVQVLLDLGRVESIPQALEVFADWRLSVWNCVFADSRGSIAYQMCGSVPRRPITTRGTRPAAESEHEWTGYWSTPELPGEVDPACGWVGSANNPPIAPAAVPGMYGTYADGYRHQRIGQALERGVPHTPEGVGELQADNRSLRAEQLSPCVVVLLNEIDTPASQRMARHLGNWNYCFDVNQIGATIWAILWPRLVKNVGHAVLDPFTADLNAVNAGRLTRALLLGEDVAVDVDLRELLQRAAEATMKYLVSIRGGGDENRWRWGKVQIMALTHPLAERSELARAIFNPPRVACPGGPSLINNRSSRETASSLLVTGGPSYRFTADMATDVAAGVMLSGQSGQPGHRHYSDQLLLWPVGKLRPLVMGSVRVEELIQSQTQLIATDGEGDD